MKEKFEPVVWQPFDKAMKVLLRRHVDRFGHAGDAFSIGSKFPIYPEDIKGEAAADDPEIIAIREYWNL